MSFQYRRIYRGPIQAVVLDWAGTVVDYGSCAPASVFIEVFKRYGVNITTAQAREPMGMNKRAHIQKILQMTSVQDQWRRNNGKLPSEGDIDSMYRDFIPLQMACLPRHSEMIPGVLEACVDFRKRNLKIGTTTGYNSEMIGIVSAEAGKQGFVPDSIVCASDVVLGRPAPWMAFQTMQRLNVYPSEACVKIGDTVADVEEGLNSGMWTVGVAKTGNELGLSFSEMKALSSEELSQKLVVAYSKLNQAGAHFVVDGVENVPEVLNIIQERILTGERP